MAGRKGEKHWRDAVMLAINETVEGDPTGRKKLRIIADKVTDLAMDGDMQAIKEIGDRVDGRAPAEVNVTTTDDMTDAQLIERIRRLDDLIADYRDSEGAPGTRGTTEKATRH